MAIDLVLWNNTKAGLATWARNHPPANPLLDADGNVRQGVSYCWWGGESGKFMLTKQQEVDGVVTVPATFAPGVVMLLHLDSDFFANDKLAEKYDAEGNKRDQWEYSKVAKYIRDNGTPGTVFGIPFYEINGTRIFRPSSVDAYIQANGVTGHTWADGNAY